MGTRIADIGKLNYLVDRKAADPNWEGYAKGTHTDARKAVYKDILEGFNSLQEAEEYIEGQPEDKVTFTARGDEIRFSMLRVVIGHIKRNKWYSPWVKGPAKHPAPSKRHAIIMWTRELGERRVAILQKLGMMVDPYWAQPFAKLPPHYQERLTHYYHQRLHAVPMTSKKPKSDRRTAFYIHYWKPKSDPEVSNPYIWSGPEAQASYISLDAALRAASELESEDPEAFDIQIYSREERYEPDEDLPDLYGYWETIDGTEKEYDRRGRIVWQE